VARLCASSSLFSAYVFRSFFRSSVVRLHTCCVNVSPTRLYNDSRLSDLQTDKKPDTYVQMVSNISRSTPSSSIILLRPNRRRSPQRMAYIPTPTPISIRTM